MDIKKKESIVAYIRALSAIEQAIEPYQQAKKDLREDYISNNVLSREEIWQAVKAYRFVQKSDKINMDDFNSMYGEIAKYFGDDDDI